MDCQRILERDIMQVQNIQSTNFQGRAVFINHYPNSYGSKKLQQAVEQLNTMNIIKNNKFDIFVEETNWQTNARITAAKNAKETERYEAQKVTSMKTVAYPEAVIGTAKLVSYSHRNKLARIKEEKSKTFWGKIKNLFT